MEKEQARKLRAAPAGAEVQNRGIWKRFFHTCRVAHIPYLTLALYIVLNAVQSLVIVKIPQINANFFAGDASVKSLTMFIGAELLITAIGLVVNYTNQTFRAKTNRNLRNALWDKILRVKPSYYDRVSANTLLSRITVDTDSLNSFLIDVILGIAFSVYSLVLTIREMSAISLRAAFLLLVFVPLSLLISFVSGRLSLKFQNASKFRLSSLTDYLSELVASLPLVKAFNRQAYETRRGEQAADEYYTASRNLVLLDLGRQTVGTLFGILPEIVIVTMGVRMLRNSTVDAGGWYIFYQYAGALLSFVNVMASQWEAVKSIQGQLNRVSEVLYQPEEGVEPYVREIVESGDISFDNVTFRYGDTLALDKVSFTIPKNQTTALVGYSGAGKSTILKLLERVYDPDEGRILLGGADLRECSLDGWRQKMAFVPQSAPMISGTIRENVLYGVRRQVSDQEIMEAARLVRADQFISDSPEGLDRQVGQFGSKLSGGQRQKLSILRAILTQPEYLILDEPTASLDPISAGEVADAVDGLHGRATIVMIAHQPRVLRKVDHVVVMDKDHTATEGSSEDLALTNGFYAQLMQE